MRIFRWRDYSLSHTHHIQVGRGWSPARMDPAFSTSSTLMASGTSSFWFHGVWTQWALQDFLTLGGTVWHSLDTVVVGRAASVRGLTTQRPPGSNPREYCHCTAVTDRAFRRKLNTPSQDDLRVRVRSFCFWISLPHSVCGNTTQHPPGCPRD